MSCRTCAELEQFLRSAEAPDFSERLVGLTEKSLRNHVQQRDEKIERQRSLLEKHKATCQADADHAIAGTDGKPYTSPPDAL